MLANTGLFFFCFFFILLITFNFVCSFYLIVLIFIFFLRTTFRGKYLWVTRKIGSPVAGGYGQRPHVEESITVSMGKHFELSFFSLKL